MKLRPVASPPSKNPESGATIHIEARLGYSNHTVSTTNAPGDGAAGAAWSSEQLGTPNPTTGNLCTHFAHYVTNNCCLFSRVSYWVGTKSGKPGKL